MVRIVKTGTREWSIFKGDLRLLVFKSLKAAKRCLARHPQWTHPTTCPCGAPSHIGITLPCFEDSLFCFPCQQAALNRLMESVWNSKW